MSIVHINQQEVEEIIRNHHYRLTKSFIDCPSIILFTCAAISDSAAPNGFLSQPQMLTVNCPLNNKNNNNTTTTDVYQITFFVKTLPTHLPKQQEYIEGFFAFEKEVSLYKDLIPSALKIPTLSNHWAPHCYMTRSNDLIILENLTANGFRMATNYDGTLNVQHMIVALEAIAAMHASSIVMEKQKKCKIIQMYPQCLYENAYPEDKRMQIRKIGFENACRALKQMICHIPKYNGQQEDIGKKFHQQMLKIFEFCKTSTIYRNTFSHGDLWGNNVMFRYAEFNDGCTRNDCIPIEATLVDFQLARYAPPALDVLTLITITSNSDFRQKHLNRLLDAYYNHLKNELQCHGINVAEELSQKEFMESCQYYRLAGLIESCLFSHMTLLPKDLSAKMISSSDNFNDFILTSRVEICEKAFFVSEMYRERMTDMLCEIIDNFVL